MDWIITESSGDHTIGNKQNQIVIVNIRCKGKFPKWQKINFFLESVTDSMLDSLIEDHDYVAVVFYQKDDEKSEVKMCADKRG